MASYLLRIVLPNQSIRTIPLNRVTAIRAESGAKYTLLDKNGLQLSSPAELAQVGENLVVSANGKKMLYLNRFYSPEVTAEFVSDALAATPTVVSPPINTAVVAPMATQSSGVLTAAEAAAAGSATTKVAVTLPSTGWSVLSGSMGTLLWGGAAVLGGAALASGSSKDKNKDAAPPLPLAPSFSSADTAAIDENKGGGLLVYNAQASGPNPLRYSLKSGQDAHAFNIDTQTGAIRLISNPDAETKASYQFTVIALDNTTGLSAEKIVTLMVNDLDDTAPIITSANSTSINENAAVATPVYETTATDTHANEASTLPLSYSLVQSGDASAFSINATTGVVALTISPDRETKASYQFTVQVKDGANNTSQKTITLNINDVDEIRPSISQLTLTATGASNQYLNSGDVISASIGLSEPVIVTGSPQLGLNIGGVKALASYDAANSTASQLVFKYQLTGSETADNNGVSIDANSLQLNGATMQDAAANHLLLNHAALADQAAYKVDTIKPIISLVNPTVSATLGNTKSIVAQSNEVGTLYLLKSSISPTSMSDIEQAGNGNWKAQVISVANTAVSLNLSGLSVSEFRLYVADAAGNLSNAAGVKVTVAPLDLTLSAEGAQNGVLNAGDTVWLNLSATENLYVAGTPQLELTIGSDKRKANYVDGHGTQNLRFRYVIEAGLTDGDGISVAADSLSANDGSITNASSEAIALSHAALLDQSNFKVDTSVAAVNNLSQQTLNSVSNGSFDPSVVVFDLVSGQSSNHSSRTFQADKSYTIYVRVDSDAAGLTTQAGSGANAPWQQWSGAKNLSADDKLVLVGNGMAVQGAQAANVNALDPAATYVAWKTANGSAAMMKKNGTFYRLMGGQSQNVLLWATQSANAGWGNPNQGKVLATAYLNTLPANVLSTQGLV